jgi:hypothetical protein
MVCPRGNMALSEAMANGLAAAFVDRSVVPSDQPFTFRVGGDWYCPGDGTRMNELAGVVRCPSCHIALNQFIYQLVEVHPHEG